MSVISVEHHINADLRTVSEWFSSYLLTLNISKCNFVIFGSPQKLNRIQDILIKVEDTCIETDTIIQVPRRDIQPIYVMGRSCRCYHHED